MDDETIQAFIGRWSASGGGELANYQSFLIELCDLLEVDRPDTNALHDILGEPVGSELFTPLLRLARA